MKIIFLITILLSSVVYAKKASEEAPAQKTPSVAVEAQEIKVGVNGMVCAFCAQGIEKNFKALPEISSVEVSLENKFVKLKFKEGKSLSKTTISEVLKDAGYEAVFGD